MNASTIKNAAITTAMVLGVIFVLNQVAVSRNLVQKALNG